MHGELALLCTRLARIAMGHLRGAESGSIAFCKEFEAPVS